MANDNASWEKANRQQEAIMREREKALKGKPGKPLKIGKRTPGTSVSGKSAGAGKKK